MEGTNNKTIVSINLGNVGSTGRIIRELSFFAEQNGFTVYQAYPKSRNMGDVKDKDIIISNTATKYLSQRMAYFTGLNGCFAWFSTKRFLKKLERIGPDIIHLHNLHDSYINLPMLFSFIKKHQPRVIWTLHDCWAFTGHCPHFTFVNCEKWKTGCYNCPQLSLYPSAIKDKSYWLWKKKKEWFTGVKNLTIVTPSIWLGDLVKESFLGEYPVKTINNGIDLQVFKPIRSNFRKKHGISDETTVILGVSYNWTERKGIDVFKTLAKELGNEFRIVLVGTDAKVDSELTDSIISIRRTNSQDELAQIYTAADVFVNPTREDTFPTVNIEALACGTPVITFNNGGSPESIDNTCGKVVPSENIKELTKAIIDINNNGKVNKEACVKKALDYDVKKMYEQYLSLYYI